MQDVRELILDRIVDVIDAISDVTTVDRNVVAFDESQMPAVGVLEGDEEIDDAQEEVRRGRPSSRPVVVRMTPHVYIRADGDGATNVGTVINSLRRQIIKELRNDTTLNNLCMRPGSIRYLGQQSTLHAARTMVGAVALVFEFTYLLDPDDL